MRWDDLRLFLEVAERGSMRAAAKALSIDHATVSRRIRDLQARLGVRLLKRISRGYALTPAGEDMVAREMRDGVEGLNRRIALRDTHLSGTVRLTFAEALTGYITEDMAAFAALHPDITVELMVSDEFVSLEGRDADIAVRFATNPPDNLVGRRICDVAVGPYAAPAYVERVGADAPPAEHHWLGRPLRREATYAMAPDPGSRGACGESSELFDAVE